MQKNQRRPDRGGAKGLAGADETHTTPTFPDMGNSS